MENKEPIRIAQIIGKWLGGGVEAVVMNYYRHIDREKIQFDFICDSDSTNIPYEEIESLGGKVILIPPYQKVFEYQKELQRVLKAGKYKIVHSHINTLSVFPLRAAKKAGVPVRIAHSHSTSNKKEWKKNLFKAVLKPFAKTFATHYFACTEHAGRWLFGDKAFDEGKVFVLNNAIEVEKYLFNEEIRKEKRAEIGLKDVDIVIGHIGRFVEQKNHRFLIDVFDALYKENNNYKLILIGQGPLMDEMKAKTKAFNIENAVFFLGQKEDAHKYYNAFDIFLFPSLYEGLGMVAVEAQYNGLPCVASNEVPEIAKITDTFKTIALQSDVETWKNEIKQSVKEKIDRNNIEVIDDKYDITKQSYKLEEQYIVFTF
ncbi:MAG: glycosyltransferase family 1 protein [Clostridia bacterium]|nr:glycosyltransferase family 1 protein [Clostridia bacterium]